jgi:imidazolonepropionase-like amidohydrolase
MSQRATRAQAACMRAAIVVATFVVSTMAQAAAPAVQSSIMITDVTVVDVGKARHLAPATVLIVDGRIAGRADPGRVDLPAAAVRVDGRGKYLVPGLVDMHVHLFNNASRRAPNTWAFPLFVAHGVTGVRDMNTSIASLVVGYAELSYNAKVLNNSTFQPFLYFGCAVVLYFILCYPLSRWSRALERKLNAARG